MKEDAMKNGQLKPGYNVQVGNERLDDDENKKIMKRRSVECETVFGQIKGNQHFRRFYLRSTEKVRVEVGLLVMGYNIKNLIRKEQEKEAA